MVVDFGDGFFFIFFAVLFLSDLGVVDLPCPAPLLNELTGGDQTSGSWYGLAATFAFARCPAVELFVGEW